MRLQIKVMVHFLNLSMNGSQYAGLQVRGNYPFGLDRSFGGINKTNVRHPRHRAETRFGQSPLRRTGVLTAVCGAEQENGDHAKRLPPHIFWAGILIFCCVTIPLYPISRHGFDPAVGLSVLEENTNNISQRVLI
jgi:hypothetical protein